MENQLYITYNPNSQAEESTALRLQTLSNLYGLSAVLPFRQRPAQSLNSETKLRIDNSTVAVVFCLDELTKTIKEEIQYFIDIDKPTIVIYDQSKRKKLVYQKYKNIKEVSVDFSKTDDALHEIAIFLRKKINPEKERNSNKKSKQNEPSLGIALLGIGLGLLAVLSLSKER